MIFKPITTIIPKINGTDQVRNILVTKSIIVINQQNVKKSELFHLNLNTKVYEEIFVSDKHSHIFNQLFPIIWTDSTFSCVIYFLFRKDDNFCNLYWVDRHRKAFLKIKLFINNAPNNYCEDVQSIKGLNETKYDTILSLNVCNQSCHLFMEDQQSNRIIHRKVNDATNKLETLHIIDWINVSLDDNSITSNYDQSSIMISQSESIINTNKCVYNCYSSVYNEWKTIEKMKHNDQIIYLYNNFVLKLYFPNDYIQISIDGISQNINAIIFNENNNFIKLKCILPMCGNYEAWLSDENKIFDELLIHGFVKNEQTKNKFPFVPIYLIEIIIKYYWFPMINIILKEYFERNHEFLFDNKDHDDNKQLLQCWSLNSFQLWDE